MAKKKMESSTTTEPNDEAVKAAIAAGKALIEQGKTKAEAAMEIYTQIEGESQETVVKAFVEGATLTEKCFRRRPQHNKDQALANTKVLFKSSTTR